VDLRLLVLSHSGWLGTSFIGSRISTREGLPSDPGDYFINNRVIAFHFGYKGSIRKWVFHFKNILFNELWHYWN
jgi:hypothetical protein